MPQYAAGRSTASLAPIDRKANETRVTPLTARATPLTARATPLTARVTPLTARVTPLTAGVTPLTGGGAAGPRFTDLHRCTNRTGLGKFEQHRNNCGRVAAVQKTLCIIDLGLGDRFGIGQALVHLMAKAFPELLCHLGGGWRRCPLGLYAGGSQKAINGPLTSWRNEHHALSRATGAAGSSAPMHVRVRIGGRIHVNNQLDIRHIDPTSRYIRGDQCANGAIAKCVEGARSLSLGQFSTEGLHGEPIAREFRRQAARIYPSLDEDQASPVVIQKQEINEGPVGLSTIQKVSGVFDIRIRGTKACALNVKRLLLKAIRELADGPWKRRRNQMGSALPGQLLQNRFELIAEAHVEHAIGFIQGYVLNPGGDQCSTLYVVKSSAGRSHDNMWLLAQCPSLDENRCPPHHDLGSKPLHSGKEPVQFVTDLHGEFTRRNQNQHTRARACRRFIREPLCKVPREPQANGHGLARTRLGGDSKVAIVGLRVENGPLDRGQLGIASFAHRLGEGHGDASQRILRGFFIFGRIDFIGHRDSDFLASSAVATLPGSVAGPVRPRCDPNLRGREGWRL